MEMFLFALFDLYFSLISLNIKPGWSKFFHKDSFETSFKGFFDNDLNLPTSYSSSSAPLKTGTSVFAAMGLHLLVGKQTTPPRPDSIGTVGGWNLGALYFMQSIS